LGGKSIKKSKLAGIISIFLFLIISNQLILSPVVAEQNDEPYQEFNELPDGLIPADPFKDTKEAIDYFLNHPFETVKYTLKNPLIAAGYYFAFLKQVYAFESWEFGTDTPYIEIGYGENVSINIGKIDFENIYDNITFREIKLQVIMNSLSFYFKITDDDYPSNNTDGIWSVTPDPNSIYLNKGKTSALYKVKVNISLTAPPIRKNAIQSGILRIRQASIQQYGNFWEAGVFWGLLFGKLGGTTNRPSLENMRYVDILVKVKPYHKVDIKPVEPIEINPNQIVAIPITLSNLGNYKDTVGFRVVSEHKDFQLSNPIDITLKPGETKDTLLGLSAPPYFFDYGTVHELKIESYSLDDPNVTIGKQTIVLKTSGFYISGNVMMLLFVIIFFIIVIYLYLSNKRKKALEEICIKPDKPWGLTEEKNHLEKLKKEDNKKYQETLKMMYQEYQSALLWYKDFCRSKIEETKKRKKKVVKVKVKKIKKEKPKKKEKIEIIEEKTKPIKEEVKEKEVPKGEVKEEIKIKPSIKKEKDLNKKLKEKAIQKVINQQKKQNKKLGKTGGIQ